VQNDLRRLGDQSSRSQIFGNPITPFDSPCLNSFSLLPRHSST
jgi:hypothetical protein